MPRTARVLSFQMTRSSLVVRVCRHWLLAVGCSAFPNFLSLSLPLSLPLSLSPLSLLSLSFYQHCLGTVYYIC